MSIATSRHYRLVIDVCSNSLGWFVVWLNEKDQPVGLGPGGARIYPDGRDPSQKNPTRPTGAWRAACAAAAIGI